MWYTNLGENVVCEMASVHPFFEITKHGSIGSPRCGVLRGCPTPCLVGTTRGGAVPYVTADLMQLENMDIGSLPACVALEEVLLEYKHYAKQKQSLRDYFNYIGMFDIADEVVSRSEWGATISHIFG